MRVEALTRLVALRQQDGRRSPHKPLLVLLALGQLAATGSSKLAWSDTATRLATLIEEFGPASKTGRAQSAAHPFTRLRSDGVWQLDHDVPMDLITPLTDSQVVDQFEQSLEAVLRADRTLIDAAARGLVESHFPATLAPDILAAVGLDPDTVLRARDVLPDPATESNARRRDLRWRAAVLQAWDRQCAFCGYDGQIAGATVGVDAAHVRWFAFDGPDSPTTASPCAPCTTHQPSGSSARGVGSIISVALTAAASLMPARRGHPKSLPRGGGLSPRPRVQPSAHKEPSNAWIPGAAVPLGCVLNSLRITEHFISCMVSPVAFHWRARSGMPSTRSPNSLLPCQR